MLTLCIMRRLWKTSSPLMSCWGGSSLSCQIFCLISIEGSPLTVCAKKISLTCGMFRFCHEGLLVSSLWSFAWLLCVGENYDSAWVIPHISLTWECTVNVLTLQQGDHVLLWWRFNIGHEISSKSFTVFRYVWHYAILLYFSCTIFLHNIHNKH